MAACAKATTSGCLQQRQVDPDDARIETLAKVAKLREGKRNIGQLANKTGVSL